MSKMGQRRPKSLFVNVLLLAVLAGGGGEVFSQGVSGLKDLQDFLAAGDSWTPAGVWRKFVEHQIEQGREDLILDNLDESLKDK